MIHIVKPKFFGSSVITGEGLPDLQEEILVIPVPEGHSLNDLDFVVNPFKQPGVDGICAMTDHAI